MVQHVFVGVGELGDFGLDCIVEEGEMGSGSLSPRFRKGLLKLFPTVEKRFEWRSKRQVLEAGSNALEALENFSEDRLELLTLNDDGVELHSLLSAMLLPVADEESVFGSLTSVPRVFFELLGDLLNPVLAAETFRLGLVEVLCFAD